jgi:phosphoribosylaminoimidazole carboxylase PurK protein
MKSKIGILGSGQLATMLAEVAPKLNIQCELYLESTKDSLALRKFFERHTKIIFESEFFETAIMKESAKGLKIKFLPSLSVMEKLRDKATQKKVLTALKIPTSPFDLYNPKADLKIWLQKMLKKYSDQVVLKWSQLGYDGKGVFVFNPSNFNEAIKFCETSLQRNITVYAEKKIAFEKELAIVCSRNIKKQFISYPLVVSEQKNGICYKVFGPATAFGVAKNLEKKAALYAKKLSTHLNIVGTFAIEFFLDEKNKLLVNEIAPRVHNSGHYTQEAFNASQFESHLRAVLGLPFVKLKPTSKFFGMLNILGNSTGPR